VAASRPPQLCRASSTKVQLTAAADAVGNGGSMTVGARAGNARCHGRLIASKEAHEK
jgi:hypothetical protein